MSRGPAAVRQPSADARRVAYDALRAVDLEDAYLNLVLPRLRAGAQLSRRDAAFATELAYGSMRLRGRYDAILDQCVDGGCAALQPEVLTALRLGVHQLLEMRVPPYAAVNATVELVREVAGRRPVGLANAVLRRVGARSRDEWLQTLSSDAARLSHPQWVVDALADALRHAGAGDELEQLLAADNEAPAVTLVARPGLADVTELLAAGAQRCRYSPYGATWRSGDPSEIALVAAGRAGVQDEGSQLAALVVARAAVAGADARWLDLCAGPGGKAALLTGLAASRGARLMAAERLPHRAALVSSALRAYPPVTSVVVADGTRPAWGGGAFDRVLVDAPCTGLGALRRRPEARWRRTPADVGALVQVQRSLLQSALTAVRTGGVAVYVTCSPHVEETRDVVDAVLAERSDVAEEDARALLPEVPATGPGPHVQLWPHRHGTDAMFVAVLRRDR